MEPIDWTQIDEMRAYMMEHKILDLECNGYRMKLSELAFPVEQPSNPDNLDDDDDEQDETQGMSAFEAVRHRALKKG